MSICKILSAVALVGALSVSAGVAQEIATVETSGLVIPAESVSSSVSDPIAAPASSAVSPVPPPLPARKDNERIAPFSRIAIGTKSGTLGFGGQIATPITRWLNLRGGVDIFNFGYGLTNSGTNYNAELHMKSGSISADYYPFRRVSFRVSPGMLIFKSTLSAAMLVPGGNTFTENDVDYTSSPTDPVHGSGSVLFSRSTMPMLTIGFGNMIKRSEHQHWSVPFEIGAAYTGHYTMQFNLAGTVCQTIQGLVGCGSVTDPSVQANVTQEQNKINEKAKHYQLYPILTTGLSYRF